MKQPHTGFEVRKVCAAAFLEIKSVLADSAWQPSIIGSLDLGPCPIYLLVQKFLNNRTAVISVQNAKILKSDCLANPNFQIVCDLVGKCLREFRDFIFVDTPTSPCCNIEDKRFLALTMDSISRSSV